MFLLHLDTHYIKVFLLLFYVLVTVVFSMISTCTLKWVQVSPSLQSLYKWFLVVCNKWLEPVSVTCGMDPGIFICVWLNLHFIRILHYQFLSTIFSSTDPKGHVIFCHFLASVVFVTCKILNLLCHHWINMNQTPP